MNIELDCHQEEMIREQLASGRFASISEVLTTALSGLPRGPRAHATAVQRMMEFAQTNTVRLPPGESVDALVREARRY